jgi:hypothetical protein
MERDYYAPSIVVAKGFYKEFLKLHVAGVVREFVSIYNPPIDITIILVVSRPREPIKCIVSSD